MFPPYLERQPFKRPPGDVLATTNRSEDGPGSMLHASRVAVNYELGMDTDGGFSGCVVPT